MGQNIMVTKKQIFKDFTQAMKDKDELRKKVLEAIKAEILVYEKSSAFAKIKADKEGEKEVDSESLVKLLKSMVKRYKDSIEAYRQGGRQDLTEQEKAELEIVESYLPEQMSEEQIKKTVEKIVRENNFTASDFGKAMGVAMSQLKGQADGAMVSKVVKEVLGEG